MSLPGYVSAAYVGLLYSFLQSRGHDPERILGRPAPARDDNGGRLPLGEWKRLLETADRALREPALGLQIARHVTPAHFGVLGYVLLCCASVGEALARLETYIRTAYDAEPLQMRHEGPFLTLEWGLEYGVTGQLVDETALGALVHFGREVTATSFELDRVGFVNPAPPDLRPYRDFFRCPVTFGSRSTTIRFRLDALTAPLRHADPNLLAILEQQAEAVLRRLPQEDDFSHRLRQTLIRLCLDREPSLERVAETIGVSPRTLQRRLDEHGLRFQAVLDDTRRLLAMEYLRDERLQLVEIAQLLGYSDQSAFTRAFRRWTGETPRRVRQHATSKAPA